MPASGRKPGLNPELAKQVRLCREQKFHESREQFAERLSDDALIAQPITVKMVEKWENCENKIPGFMRNFLAHHRYWDLPAFRGPTVTEEKIGELRHAIRDFEDVQVRLLRLLTESQEKWKKITLLVMD